MSALVKCQELLFDITVVPRSSGSLDEPTVAVVRLIIGFSKEEGMNGSGSRNSEDL